MFNLTSRFTIVSGSAAVVVAASAAVAVAATNGGASARPTPVPVAATAHVAAASHAVAAHPVALPARHVARRVLAKKATAPAEAVAMAAPPPGVTIKMPKLQPRVAVAGATVDANGVNVTGRPQMKLAMTDAQTQPYWDRYDACLHAHGVPLYPGRGLSPVQNDPSRPPAEKACEDQMPLMPIALDSTRNPHFKTDLTNEIACINTHGDPVVADPAGGFWTYRAPRTARERFMSSLKGEPARTAVERACELQAFAADDHPQS